MSAPVIDLDNLESTPPDSPRRARTDQPRVCFVGFNNLAVLAPQFDTRGAAGEPVQQTLLALAFARRDTHVDPPEPAAGVAARHTAERTGDQR